MADSPIDVSQMSDAQILSAIASLSNEAAMPEGNSLGVTTIKQPEPLPRPAALDALIKQPIAPDVEALPDALTLAAMSPAAPAPQFQPDVRVATMPVHKASFIKKLLSNFLEGAGAAMMHSAGLRTPQEEALLEREMQLRERGQAAREYEIGAQVEHWGQMSQQEKSELEFRRKQFQVAAADKGFKFDPETGTLEEMSDDAKQHWTMAGRHDEPTLAVRCAMGDQTACTAISILHPPKPAPQPSTYAEMALAYEQETDPTLKAQFGNAMARMDKRERERAMLQRPESESDHDRKLRRDSTIYAADMLAKQGGDTAQAITGLLSQMKNPAVINDPEIYERVAAALMLLRKEDLLKQATNTAMTQSNARK